MRADRKSRRASAHYVYLYRDSRGKCRYVGYGKNPSRATDHLSGSHSDSLNSFLAKAKGKYTIEHGGPYFNKDMGRAVETALITVVEPSCNRDLGPTKWRFRPFGVPQDLARRLYRPPLKRDELVQRCIKDNVSPALFVYISSKKFTDGRVGYDPSNPATDAEILDRMDHQWQLRTRSEKWCREPRTSPGILIAVAGKPNARIIIGAVKIDRHGWASTHKEGSDIWIPTRGPRNLDALRLRGRRISPDANIKFGSIRPLFFYLLSISGRAL